MNPILLKPNGNGTSQVVLDGHVWKTLSARDYYTHFDELLTHVLSAYEDLARRFDVIVIEGAGSVSELNLRPSDLVNLGLVTRIGAPWVLVADIERGGVFASVLGTISLLTPEERALFRGFLVNRFRGDMSLFDEGRRMLQEMAGAPCLGVFPYADGITLDAEDSLALDREPKGLVPDHASIAIVQLPRLSNGTDFRLLRWADWVTAPDSKAYDFVILPGTKDTLADLAWMRARGLDTWVLEQHQRGATVIGICGGFQMMGDVIRDPDRIESIGGTASGLGLLPAETVLLPEKTTRLRRATTGNGVVFSAYEIHMGQTTLSQSFPPFARLDDGQREGVRAPRLVGTYLHGALEDAGLCSELFGTDVHPGAGKEARYTALAEWFDRYAQHPTEWLG
jgi:adenosylcobyric acid synthase